MGKKLINASHHSWKTALQLYTKVVTFVFALFCVASGQVQVQKNSINDTEKVTFRGRALSVSDSTAFSNVKILLTSRIGAMYGVGVSFFDTTHSDANGYFELEPNLMHYCYAQVVVQKNNESGERMFFGNIEADVVFCDEDFNEDSVYTFYLMPIHYLSVKQQSKRNLSKQLQITQGRKISINYSELNTGGISDITVIDLKGKIVATLQPRPEGIVFWDTRDVARGVYFVRLRNGVNDINLRLLVK
ncbi:hypothetical protein CHISP_2418 [Chitinispirillum alkaliphilum]|nr:hypothetical protein CHISP_2418 [Chitinispirillum alkaliphilum]